MKSLRDAALAASLVLLILSVRVRPADAGEVTAPLPAAPAAEPASLPVEPLDPTRDALLENAC